MNLALRSALAVSIQGVIDLRQSLGYGDSTFRSYLVHFDRFLADRGWTGVELTRELVEEWACSGGPLRPKSRANRLSALRALALYHAQMAPQSYVPGPTWGPRQSSSFRPHIYTSAEIQALLAGAAQLTPQNSLRPVTYVTLISLLFSSGLRISEALALQLADVELEDGILIIRESKFHKSRMVPLHETATTGLLRYQEARNARRHSTAPEAPLFVNEWGRACKYPTVVKTFLAIARRAGIRGAPGVRGPRIHDARHTFAVRRLLEWYRDGANVQSRLPLLTTYLGHVSMVSTQIYLDITAELLHEAARCFRAPNLTSTQKNGGAACL